VKLKLLILSFALSCLAADEPKKDINLLTDAVKGINIRQEAADKLYIRSSESHSIQLTAPASGGLIVYDQPAGEVLQVTGIGMIQLGNPSPYQGIRYARPDKPDAVKAVLTTKDGKRWVAVWTEEKP
jgi:hypothetical protein